MNTRSPEGDRVWAVTYLANKLNLKAPKQVWLFVDKTLPIVGCFLCELSCATMADTNATPSFFSSLSDLPYLSSLSSSASFSSVGTAFLVLLLLPIIAQLLRWQYVKWRLRDVPGPSFGLLGGLPSFARNVHRLYDLDIDRFNQFNSKVYVGGGGGCSSCSSCSFCSSCSCWWWS